MIKIRIGNDLPIIWRFFTKDSDRRRIPYIIAGHDVRIVMTDGNGRSTEIDAAVTDNSASWIFKGKDQAKIGAYTFTFYENFGKDGMKALDKIHPFCLVPELEVIKSGTVDGCMSSMEISPVVLESDLPETVSYESLSDLPKINHIVLLGDKTPAELGLEAARPYLSLERLHEYLYRVTFDSLPEDNGGDSPVGGGCSSYVKDGKLYSNLDWDYDNTASFIVRTRDFEGQSFVGGLNDGNLNDDMIAQLPYRVHRGINNHGIKLAAHVLYNDWQWTGCGERSVNLTRLPFLVLTRVKSMATIAADLDGILDNLYAPDGLAAMGYLLQLIVTDGTTTYAIMPPTSEGQSYVLQNISSNPKLTNFRWVGRTTVVRTDSDIQTRPTGVERWNMMPCALEDLRFTKAYEAPTRLSEFIGLRETTKESSDAELESIYEAARALYLGRERDGKTWQTMESVVYGNGMEELYIQENWDDDYANYFRDLKYHSFNTLEAWQQGSISFDEDEISYIVATGEVLYGPYVAPLPPNDEIWYTSTDGNIVEPTYEGVPIPIGEGSDSFGANIVSNVYNNGKGVIKFDGDITEVADGAFAGSNLSSIMLANSVTRIGDYAFTGCYDLITVKLANSITSIGEEAFSYCTSLSSVNLPNSMSRISRSTFMETALTSIEIPNSVDTIEYRAFSFCHLSSVVLPESITYLQQSVFDSCNNLTVVVCKAPIPPTLEAGWLGTDSITSIKVPAESVEAYKTATNWIYYADIIVPIE